MARQPARPTPALLAYAAAVLLAGCTADAPDRSRTDGPSAIDGTGRTVVLEAPARRVVSLVPAVTEWVTAMGAADRLVARTDYDRDPALDTLPSLGGGLTPSIEWLAARQPDLVVAWPDAPSRSLVARLEDLDIPVYTAPVETVEEGVRTARDLGTLLGREEAAEAVIRAVREGLDTVSAAVGDRAPPDVLFLIGLDPLMAAGPGTFVDQLVRRAGGRNVLEDMGVRWPQLSLEEVVRRQPEVLIIGVGGVTDPVDRLAGRPGWSAVPAVRSGRVHTVDPDRVNRPGPGMADAAARLARLIHGETGTASP